MKICTDLTDTQRYGSSFLIKIKSNEAFSSSCPAAAKDPLARLLEGRPQVAALNPMRATTHIESFSVEALSHADILFMLTLDDSSLLVTCYLLISMDSEVLRCANHSKL